AGRFLAMAVLSVAALATLVPFLWMLGVSVRTPIDLFEDPTRLVPLDWTFGGYQAIWEELPFLRLLVNTFVFAGGATVLLVFFDSLAGFAFARLRFRGSKALFLVVIATLMVPFQTAIVPVYLLELNLGWLNTYQGLIVPRMASALGIFLIRQFLLSIPPELDEAARIDGAGNWRIYRSVIMPLAKPALASLFIIQFVALWNDFLWPLVISTSIEMRTLPAALTLFSSSTSTVNYAALMAGAAISVAPLALIFLLAQRYFVQGIASSGLK
ncbi:MAG TPA: carbohydrate ABC transporter permease, partial [Protaetiibacter sp.]|nr:carbohydrate ABC transporter permease [Protaetiibacter sp.]